MIVFKGSYHGRSLGTMPLTTSKSVYRSKFGPFMGGIFVAPFAWSEAGVYEARYPAGISLTRGPWWQVLRPFPNVAVVRATPARASSRGLIARQATPQCILTTARAAIPI